METKQRHGCVTGWLIFMIIANALSALSYLFLGDTISQNLPNPISQPMMLMLAAVSIVNLLLAIMLFKWKKWAFWAFAGTSLIVMVINLALGLGIGTSLLGIAGIAILYGILNIKKDGEMAWENLD